MEIEKFLTDVQGSDEHKDAFLSKFAESNMGKNYLDLYVKNNTPKHFNVDDKGQIINDSSLDEKIGAFVGFERSQVHTSRDAKIEALTGVKRNDGETKGYAERALNAWRDSEIEKAKGNPDQALTELKERHVAELQALKDGNLTSVNDWEKKYNTLQNEYTEGKKDNDWNNVVSTLGLDLSKMKSYEQAGVKAIIQGGKGMYHYEDGKGVLKNPDGTIQRKSNQENVTIEDYLRDKLSDVLQPQQTQNGGGYQGSANGDVGYNGIISGAKTRTEINTKFNELMQKKGVSPRDAEYTKEYAKIMGESAYKALPR